MRPMIKEDAKYFVVWFNDKEVIKWLMWRDEKETLTLEYEEKWIEEMKTSETWKTFTIEALIGCMKIQVPIGNCSIHNIDQNNRRAGLGVNIGEKEFWRQGYGTEATKLLLGYAFRELNLHRIESVTLEDNDRAIGVLKKVGYKQEGCRRCYILKGGRFRDVLIFGILDQEFKNE